MTRLREDSAETTTEQQKSLFLDFAHRLLGKINDWTREEPVTTHISSRVEFTNEGWQVHTDHWKDYHYLISSRREVVQDWPEAEKCTRSHLVGGVLKIGEMSDSAGKPIIAPTFDQVYPYLFLEMIRPVVDTLKSDGGHDVTDEQLLEEYCGWRSFHLRSSDAYMLIAPLQRGFTSEIDSIKVTEDIEFCALTLSLKSHLVSDPAPSLGPRPMDISMLNYCLIAKFDQSRDHPGMASGSPDLRKDITHFMSALRLLKTGTIDYAALFTLSEDNPRGGIGISSENWESWGSEYCLEEDDVTGLLTLFRNLRLGSRERWIQPLEIGLRKFEDSYGRRKAEDRLIDLTIALESTLLAGTDDELK